MSDAASASSHSGKGFRADGLGGLAQCAAERVDFSDEAAVRGPTPLGPFQRMARLEMLARSMTNDRLTRPPVRSE
jgi:hypothetical protein